jgi:anti-sigma regulatory factor (Ser/Thr protein kinase)
MPGPATEAGPEAGPGARGFAGEITGSPGLDVLSRRMEADVAGPRHQALIWRNGADRVAAVAQFIQEGVRRGEPVYVGVIAAAGDPLRAAADGQPHVRFFDMAELGRNPGRIIPAMLDFAAAYPGGPVRFLTEPCWAGRSAAENAEAARHESLVELALSEVAATVLCVYDARAVGVDVIACAEQTHPVISDGGPARSSARYAGLGVLPPACDHPLPPPPLAAARLAYQRDLRPVRALVAGCAATAGLAPDRAADLVLAASEVAANTLRHTRSGGTLTVWLTDQEVICQVSDSGYIANPLAGRRRPVSDTSGQGLWVVHQVCDLVQVRTDPDGTTVRMRMRRDPVLSGR